MTRRYELKDEEFALIADLLPPVGRPGGRWNDHRTTLDGVLWILHTGAQWRELPERYGKWKSVYDRFNRWARDGTIDRILERLHLELDASGRIDFDLWCIDGTSIRAGRAAAGAGGKRGTAEPADHALGRSRGGFGTKLHLVVDSGGVPLSAVVTAGRAHESRSLEPALEAVRIKRPGRGRPRRRPRRLAGDKGYSYRRIRRYLRRRGIKAVIPTRKDQRRSPTFDAEAYRRRNIVERCILWMKENRRLATRFEKLAVNFLAMVKLAMIRRCFRLIEPSDRT
ncbi:IS5 family transposase [Planctomyces sp. SH-PL62]|uniref:IS5 family transposase n=1 Tax=Planctomyces sp. SH-PL62 TaxID=1636152 RepID=UPI001E598FF4|nr:IS5 family transposase [Planctomyces sp. SH-PL62]